MSRTRTVERSPRDARIRTLYRLPKGELVDQWIMLHPQTIWTATPPARWSRDELINGILSAEGWQ